MKFVVDDKIPYIQGVLEACGDVLYLPGAKISPEDVTDADCLIVRTRTICNEELLAGSSVKFIATATIGFDHIDRDYCKKADIEWTNCPGCNSGSVKQYLTSTLLRLAIKHSISLKGKTLGVIGVGNVGSKVAQVGRALGMNVLLNDPPRERAEGANDFTPLDTLIAESDFISIHTPLNREGIDKTFHLADNAFFEAMKPSAFIINTSRGETVSNRALVDALKSRELAGAVLDVWENEPGIDLELMNLVDYATPHIAGYSKDGKANGTSMSVQAASKFFELDLDDWFPPNVPVPENTVAKISGGESLEQQIFEVVSLSYDIAGDDQNLRNDPSMFEKLRGDYPLRREFELFSANTTSEEIAQSLTALGFSIL